MNGLENGIVTGIVVPPVNVVIILFVEAFMYGLGIQVGASWEEVYFNKNIYVNKNCRILFIEVQIRKFF